MGKKATFALAIMSLIASAAFVTACESTPEECEHEGGTATCQTRAICDKCGEEYGELAAHDYGDWKHNETDHWKECLTEGCTSKSEESNHSGGTATCVAKAVCEICGVEYGGFAAHNYGSWQHDDEKHWKECLTEGCSNKGEEGEHGGGMATCTAKAVCEACGEEYGALAPHVYNVWKHNETEHWKACECGAEETTKSTHNYNVWVKDGSSYDYKACECGAEDKTNVFHKKVSLINQNLLLTNTAFSIKLDGVSTYSSIESIKFGNYDLGKDINALTISDELKADTKQHGKQTISVVVKDGDGEEHTVRVPVTFITKEIASAEDFRSIQPSSTVKGVYGYYVLTKDISDTGLSGNAYAGGDWAETTGFFGTLDGQWNTITTAANERNGMFGILRGATVKNLTIKDDWRGGYQSYALFAKACFNSTIENVTFEYAAGNRNSSVGDGYGWFCYAEFSGNTLRNVTVNDKQGYGSLFGYKFANNTFDNVTINGTYTEMGHTANVTDKDGNVTPGVSVSYDDVLKAEKSIQVKLENRQDFILDGGETLLDLGEYKDCEIISITTSTGYELYSLSSAVANDTFKEAKQAHGEQNFIVTVLNADGTKVEITVPVTVITKSIKTMAELQDCVKLKKDATQNIYGYYILKNDVSCDETGYKSVAAAMNYSGGVAFRGVLDGRNCIVTIKSSATVYGLFGTLNHATIKNVTFKDLSNQGPYETPLLAANAYESKFENLNIEICGGAAKEGANGRTPFVGNVMQKCTWTKVKITSSVDIVNVFANQSDNTFDLEIIANVTVGFSTTSAGFPDGVTVKKN